MHSTLPPVHLDHVAPAALRWKQADHDVYVATLHDEFAGFIAVTGDDRFALHGPQGQPMGAFRTQHEARAALRAELLEAAAPAPETRKRATPPRRTRRPRARVRG